MNRFTFESKQRSILIGLMVLGLVCLGITWFTDDALHTRFWSNFLHNTVFFTGISFVTLFAMCAFITAYAGWFSLFKRVFEAYSQFMIIGLVLFLVIIAGVWGHFHHIYHWADAEAVATDSILAGKATFLNKYVYTIATLAIVGIWYFLFVQPLRKISLREDMHGTTDYHHHNKIRWYSAAFLPFGAFTSAALIWQWVMSIDAHWYSTMFAWYATASFFVSALCLIILTLLYLKSKGYYEHVTQEHIHDLGKFVFAFSIFWTYVWFSQYMLIWYGNVGEETEYFHTRINEYPILFYGNLILNFVLPFLILMRNDTKRKFGSVGVVCLIVLFGHWFDFFNMIKPGVLHTAHEALAHHGDHVAEGSSHAHDVMHHAEHASTMLAGFSYPSLLDIGTFLGFFGLFMYIVFTSLAKAPLVPKNDPYLGESLHHHT